MDKNFNFSNISLNNEISIERVILRISHYKNFVTIPLGIIGNVISIFIFTRPCLNKKTNTGLLFTILCLLNLIIILNEALLKWRTIYSQLRIHFRIEKYLVIVIEQSFSWIQSLITFDRFITVFYPVKGTRMMNKKWVLFSIIFGILVFISSANSIYVLLNSSTFITHNKEYSRLLLIYNLIDTLMKNIIPYLIIVVFDVMVIVRMRRSKPEFRSRESRKSRSARFSINTIIIDILFLICNFPSALLFYNHLKLYIDNYHTVDFFITLVFYANVLFSNIYSHLFFFLFLIFNRIFRHEFISIFNSIFKQKSCFNNIIASSS